MSLEIEDRMMVARLVATGVATGVATEAFASALERGLRRFAAFHDAQLDERYRRFF
jgi:hypothetical protein